MLKKVMSILLIYSLLAANVTFARSASDTPRLPPQDPNEHQIAIVQTKTNYTEEQMERLLKGYPSLKRRHRFQEVLTGFSVEGTWKEIEQLKQNELVNMVSQVQTYSVENENPVELIGAESLRLQTNKKSLSYLSGKGIKIGIIDTGLDYRHPDLQKNYKKGWDFVDDDKDPMETKGLGRKDTLHGTHVAGIIAANGKIKGVAPHAEIYAYRALGPGGSGTTEQILAAIDQAVKDKMDIINLSLGSDVNGPDLPLSIALNKVVEKGIIAIAAAGNAGPEDWTVGSPGTASKAISVGASTPNIHTAFIYIDEQRIPLLSMKNSEDWKHVNSAQIVFGGLGKKTDLSDVHGKIVLIERGELTFSEKVKNAYEKGAKGVIIYNNFDGPFQGMLEKEVPIPVAGITKQEGKLILEKIKKKSRFVKIDLDWEKDLLADFSSRGPVTNTWEIKPDVLAPGVVINSTVPGGYESLQGTSMAAPHVAGACALILEAHPDWTPEEVKAALMNTSKLLRDRKDLPYRVYEQGAGRIQVDEAIKTKVLVMPGSIRFGKFKLGEHQDEHTSYIQLKNVGKRVETISFAIPKKTMGVRWELPLSTGLKPGETKNVPITMIIENEVYKNKLQDGFLQVNVGMQKINIPYLYVFEEPDYPRIMGFDLRKKEKDYEYEVYLPGGAEEFGIALFDADSLRFIKLLDWKKTVKRGMVKDTVKKEEIPGKGEYILKIFARKLGKEDTFTMKFRQ